MSVDNFARVRALAKSLPGVELSTAYGTPALKLKKALVARLLPDGKALAVRTEAFERGVLLAAEPEVFFLTAHYENHPWVLVDLARVKPAVLKDLLETACKLAAQPVKVGRPRKVK